MKKTNRRLTSIIIAAVIVLILVAIYVSGSFLPDSALRADFSQEFLAPSFKHPFGTDYLGRDMFVRTIKGLSLSLIIGMTASVISAIIGLIVGVTAALGKGWIDHAINWFIDVFMSCLLYTSFAVCCRIAQNELFCDGLIETFPQDSEDTLYDAWAERRFFQRNVACLLYTSRCV